MTPGNMGIAAHQAEAEEEVEEREQEREKWEFGDEDTYLEGSYACERCSEENGEYTLSSTRGKQLAQKAPFRVKWVCPVRICRRRFVTEEEVIRHVQEEHTGQSDDASAILLPVLYQHIVPVAFPPRFFSPYQSMITRWKAKDMAYLERTQRTWDDNKHTSAYIRQHPIRPTTLDSGSGFSEARMLRVCSDLPCLATLLSSGLFGALLQ